jgi:hypothetical protein
MTRGSYLFVWPIAEDGYHLVNNTETTSAQIDIEEVDRRSPWIVPQGQGRRSYSPLSKVSLHREFGQLDETEGDVITFANRYGLLGHNVALTQPGVTTHEISETPLGESLKRWRQEIRLIGPLLAMWDLVNRKRAGKLGQIVVWPTPEQVEVRLLWTREKGLYHFSSLKDSADFNETDKTGVLDKAITGLWDHRLLGRWRRGDVIEPALYFICREINQKLKGYVSPQVLPFVDKKLFMQPQTLLAAMWLMFMWEITGETKVLRCPAPSCGHWFEQIDAHTKYCSNACKQKRYYVEKVKRKKEPLRAKATNVEGIRND